MLTRQPMPVYGDAPTLDRSAPDVPLRLRVRRADGRRRARPAAVADRRAVLRSAGRRSCRCRSSTGRGTMLGFRFGRFAYLTDCNGIPDSSLALLDGSRLPRARRAAASAASDAFHARRRPSRWRGRIGARQTYFTHIAHDLGHEATCAALPAGMALAHDGLDARDRLALMQIVVAFPTRRRPRWPQPDRRARQLRRPASRAQQLIEQVRRQAGERGGTPVAMIFDPHPPRVLRPDKAPPLLMTLDQKLEAFERAGLQGVAIVRFTHELSRWEPETFVETVLIDWLRVAEVWVGANFLFGRDRPARSRCCARSARIAASGREKIDPVRYKDFVVSSTRMRHLVAEGRVDEAGALLGHHYFIDGTVVHGDGRGRELGFPTANLADRQRAAAADRHLRDDRDRRRRPAPGGDERRRPADASATGRSRSRRSCSTATRLYGAPRLDRRSRTGKRDRGLAFVDAGLREEREVRRTWTALQCGTIAPRTARHAADVLSAVLCAVTGQPISALIESVRAMSDPFTLTVPADPRYRGLAPEVAGRVRRSGGRVGGRRRPAWPARSSQARSRRSSTDRRRRARTSTSRSARRPAAIDVRRPLRPRARRWSRHPLPAQKSLRPPCASTTR